MPLHFLCRSIDVCCPEAGIEMPANAATPAFCFFTERPKPDTRFVGTGAKLLRYAPFFKNVDKSPRAAPLAEPADQAPGPGAQLSGGKIARSNSRTAT
jgi:hypothetical protein